MNNIEIIYANKNKNKSALKYYKEALKFQLGIENPKEIDLADIATTYSNIGCIYACQQLFSKALINHGKALNIQLKHLPKGHPDIGRTYNNIGFVYHEQSNCRKALENHQIALDNGLMSLTDHHPDLSTTYNNMATSHYRNRNYQLAIQNYEKACQRNPCGIKM